MRNFRNALSALVLALVFTMPAFADDGIMTSEKTPPPPPPPSANGIMTTDLTDGIMHSDAVESATVTDPATEIALSLLQTALALF
jgi:hypothetical protein